MILAIVNLKGGGGKATTAQYFAAATGLYSELTRYEKCFGSRPAYFNDYKKAWAETITALCNGIGPRTDCLPCAVLAGVTAPFSSLPSVDAAEAVQLH